MAEVDKKGEKYYILLHGKCAEKRDKGITASSRFGKDKFVTLLKGEILIEACEREQPKEKTMIRLNPIEKLTVSLECPVTDVQRIDEDEANLLLGLSSLSERLRVFQERDTLRIAKEMVVGSRVWVTMTVHGVKKELSGVIKHKGPLPGSPGTMFGVELLASVGKGSTDGSFKGQHYFHCEKDAGVFVSLEKLKPRNVDFEKNSKDNKPKTAIKGGTGNHDEANKGKAKNRSSLSSSSLSKQSSEDFGDGDIEHKIEDAVWVFIGEKPHRGIVKYIGRPPGEKQIFAGIQMDTDCGEGDGEYYGKQLFTCLNNHAHFTPIENVISKEKFRQMHDDPKDFQVSNDSSSLKEKLLNLFLNTKNVEQPSKSTHPPSDDDIVQMESNFTKQSKKDVIKEQEELFRKAKAQSQTKIENKGNIWEHKEGDKGGGDKAKSDNYGGNNIDNYDSWHVVGDNPGKNDSTGSTNGRSKERLSLFNVNSSVYHGICAQLNTPVPNKDYKALAERMGYTSEEIQKLQQLENPADALLFNWAYKNENDVNKLIELLRRMGRSDVVEILETHGGSKERSIFNVSSSVHRDICARLNTSVLNKDWKTLAGHMGCSSYKIRTLEQRENPASALLNHWATNSENDVNKLIEVLKRMERYDIVQILELEGGSKEKLSIFNVSSSVYRDICARLSTPILNKDWKTLAGHMGYTSYEIKTLEQRENPASALLNNWATNSENDVNKLIEVLKRMERYDIVEMLEMQDSARKKPGTILQESQRTQNTTGTTNRDRAVAIPSQLDGSSYLRNISESDSASRRLQRHPTAPEASKENNESSLRSDSLERELDVGSVVEVLSKHSSPKYGVIRWIGFLPTVFPKVAGLELEEKMDACSDGTFQSTRYFTCSSQRAFFVHLRNCKPDSRFGKSENSLPSADRRLTGTDFGSFESPTMEGQFIPPPDSLDVYTTGKGPRGIQGHHNSCYLDATLFAAFAYSSVMDSILLRPKQASDIEQYKEVQNVLRDNIVYPLRAHGFVRADRVLDLRKLLDKLGTVTGLVGEEKDPEEFLLTLFQQVLKSEPFLKIKSGREVRNEYFYQVFADKDVERVLPSVEELLKRSFHQSDLKLAEVPSCLIVQMPRFGKGFKMYKRILPSLMINIGELVDNTPQDCAVCGRLAKYHCKDCFSVTGFMENDSSGNFCTECNDRIHSHVRRTKHKSYPLAVPRDISTSYGEKPVEHREMELFAVVCIETSHYVTFAKCKDLAGVVKWCFFDSMADRVGTKNGYNIPSVTECPEVVEWLSSEKQNRERIINTDDRDMPDKVRRILGDAYMCLYQSVEMARYK